VFSCAASLDFSTSAIKFRMMSPARCSPSAERRFSSCLRTWRLGLPLPMIADLPIDLADGTDAVEDLLFCTWFQHHPWNKNKIP
jgi:hypothetical protein